MSALHAFNLPTIPLAYFVINIDPIALRIGPLAIHWYGLAYVVAIFMGAFTLTRWCPKMGIHEDQLYGLLLWTALAGLIGGRLYFVIQQPDLVSGYLLQPARIFEVWNGGMAFFGAIFAGTLTLFFLAPRYGLSRWIAIDGGAVFAIVGQIFGRLGNVINGDILGTPASAGLVNIPGDTCAHAPCIAYVADPHIQPAWSFVYLNPNNHFTTLGVAYQPAQVYEMLMNVAILLLLFPLRNRLPRIRAGYFFVFYLACYAVSQFVVFFFRATEPTTPFLGISVFKQAQWTAILVLILCIPLFFAVRRLSGPWAFSAKNPVPWPPASAAAKSEPTGGATGHSDSSERALQAVAAELPAWQPTRATGGALRNVFSPPAGRGSSL